MVWVDWQKERIYKGIYLDFVDNPINIDNKVFEKYTLQKVDLNVS